MQVPEGEESEKGAEKLFGEIVAKNVLKIDERHDYTHLKSLMGSEC